MGRKTAMAAIASVLPAGALTSLQAMAQKQARRPGEEGPQDRLHPDHLRDALIIMAHPLGFYRNEGLSVEVVKTAAGH